MYDPKIIAQLTSELIDRYSDRPIFAKRGGSDPRSHVKWMMEQVPQYIDMGKRERAMRWLGFAQGFLWSQGYVSIEELRSINKGRLPFRVDPVSKTIDLAEEYYDEEPTQDGQISAAR